MIPSALSLTELPARMMKQMKSLSQSSDSGISTTVENETPSSSASSTGSSDSLPDPETQVMYDEGTGNENHQSQLPICYRIKVIGESPTGTPSNSVEMSSTCPLSGTEGEVGPGTVSPVSSTTGESIRNSTGSSDSSEPDHGCSSNGQSKSEKKCSGGTSRKRKKERYEICIGYPCFEFNVNESKTVFVYSLQKNKDMMEDLLGHSKLKSSKSFICYFFSSLVVQLESCVFPLFPKNSWVFT